MTALRPQDKLFLAVVLTIAATAAYFHLWRADAARRTDALARTCAELVTAEDFPLEREQATRQRQTAQDELAAERKIPLPAVKVKGKPTDSLAAREWNVLAVLRTAHLTVTRSRTVEPKSTRCGDTLRATGTRPEPICRTYEVVGTYEAVQAALTAFCASQAPVIPESLTMPQTGHWILTLWL